MIDLLFKIWWITTAILGFLGIFGQMIAIGDWGDTRNRRGSTAKDKKEAAQTVVTGFVIIFVLIPLWPLVLPLLLLTGIWVMIDKLREDLSPEEKRLTRKQRKDLKVESKRLKVLEQQRIFDAKIREMEREAGITS